MKPLFVNPRLISVAVATTQIYFYLKDGRMVRVPIVWFPRLQKATRAQTENFKITGQGEGVHWPEIDEDISLSTVLMGKRE